MSSRWLRRLRLVAGVVVIDLPVWARALSGRPRAWVYARNRRDPLEVSPDGSGARVPGLWTSEMHAAKVLPCLGRMLLARAVAEHPLVLLDAPRSGSSSGVVDVSVLIGHRGQERLPLLLTTLRSFAGQNEPRFECVVIEQSPKPEIESKLPPWVRYFHQPWPDDMPYGRSQAFNRGAREARGETLVFHDNDMLVPNDYLQAIVRWRRGGHDFVNLKRFVFYLDRQSTERVLDGGRLPAKPGFDAVTQNLLGGGSVAAGREAFAAIGGFDEGFVGWGGEDEEFWERAQTRRVFSWGSHPIVHLWHAPQPGKAAQKRTPGMGRLQELRKIPVSTRIGELLARSRTTCGEP